MESKNEIGIYSVTKEVMTEIVGKSDTAMKESIIKYAQKRSKELGHEIEVMFLDKEIADQIINLGIKEYIKNNGFSNIPVNAPYFEGEYQFFVDLKEQKWKRKFDKKHGNHDEWELVKKEVKVYGTSKEEMDEAISEGGRIKMKPEEYENVRSYLMKNGIFISNSGWMSQKIAYGHFGEGDTIEITLSKEYI